MADTQTLLIQFTSEGAPLPVAEFSKDTGVVFAPHADASPLNIAFGLQAVLPADALRRVQSRNNWPAGEFKLNVSLDAGGLLISPSDGKGINLPQGVYDVSIEIEGRQFKNSQFRVTLKAGKRTTVTLDEIPDRRKIRLVGTMDDQTASVVNAAKSQVDGMGLAAWLANKTPRASRKACLLNMLAKLRTPPKGLKAPLLSSFEYIYYAEVDRIYAAAAPALVDRVQSLVDKQQWVAEGEPIAAIHARLKDSLVNLGISKSDAARFGLSSFRQGGRNSLQICFATPPAGFPDPTVYTDVDIDLGNPLWDLEGLFVHIGELLDPSRTDHIALFPKLKDSDAKDFLYYEPVK